MATRSSLELMLDKLKQLEEQPVAIPPALPFRPVSRARLPRPRRPLQLDFDGRSGENSGFERERRKKDDFGESDDGIAAQLDHFLKMKQVSENSKIKGICRIQKCYRGHQVRCCYKELRKGVIALQSFIRGEIARRVYRHTSISLRAIIIIQKQTRKYLQHKSGIRGNLDRRRPNQIKLQVEEAKDQIRLPYESLVDLEKRVLKTGAKLRGKREENMALKRKLLEIEKKWQQYEERMKSMEKEWQDQLTYIQECLVAGNKNPAPHTIPLTSGIPNGRILDIPINSNFGGDRVDEREVVECEESEVGEERVCLKLRPHEELRKLKLRFKAWKKECKNKLRDAQSTFRKLGINAETAKSHNNWWGRLSH